MTYTLFAANWWKSIVLYLFLFLIRFVLLLIAKPLMGLTGYPVTFGEIVLMTWGALRGALALFLAMIVKSNSKINDETA